MSRSCLDSLRIPVPLNGTWGLSHGEESCISCVHKKYNFSYGSISHGGGSETEECGVKVAGLVLRTGMCASSIEGPAGKGEGKAAPGKQ